MAKEKLTTKQKREIRRLMREYKYSKGYATMIVTGSYDDMKIVEINGKPLKQGGE